LAVNVRTLVFVAGFVPNAAVTPVPIPVADSVTLPENPLAGVTVIVLVPCDPRVMVRLVGEAESVKFAAATAFTVKSTVVVWTRLPEVPVMVTVTVRVAAVLLAVNVRTLVLVIGFGPKAAVTPDGKPEAPSVAPPVKPLTGVSVIVLVPPAPP
jgi:hypothetical protein